VVEVAVLCLAEIENFKYDPYNQEKGLTIGLPGRSSPFFIPAAILETNQYD